jgi:hypothetical protein
VTIWGTARLRLFDAADLLEMAGEAALPAPDPNAEVAP